MLPLTDLRCAKKIVTELAVLDVLPPKADGGFLLRAPGVSVAQFQAATARRLELPAEGRGAGNAGRIGRNFVFFPRRSAWPGYGSR